MKTKTLSFDMGEDQLADMDLLVRKLGLKHRGELLNHAISFLNWALAEQESGKVIASVDETAGTYKEVVIPSSVEPMKRVDAGNAK